ncbi:MAG: Ig-like domain-containing protein [Clostridia bacterium]|nr:Ig-like domain-containing protein [Clostridia bacterium]
MSKKLIALMLILPMVLMMTFFTAVNTVSLRVQVPVSKIEIFGDPFVSLDIDKEEKYFVDYAVYPTTAANKNVKIDFEPVGNQPLAELEYKDGYIYPKSVGSANVLLTTADGGYKAKFQVVVKAKELKEIVCSVSNNVLEVGDETQIYTQFIPNTVTDKSLEYSSSNSSIISVSQTGLITATGNGEATITIKSVAKPSVYYTLGIEVEAKGPLSVAQKEINTFNKTGSVNLVVEKSIIVNNENLTYKVLNEYGDVLTNVLKAEDENNPFVDLSNGNFEFNYKFVNENYYGKVIVVFELTTETETITKYCTINREEKFTAEFSSDSAIYTEINSILHWDEHIKIYPLDTNVEYHVNYSNNNVVGSLKDAGCVKMGLTKATIVVKSTEKPSQTYTLEKDIYVCPEEIFINESKKAGGIPYGIEDVWTIGKYNVDGEEISHNLSLSYGGKPQGFDFDKIEEKISFVSSAPNSVSISNSGKINIIETNFNKIVQFKAVLDLPNKIETEPFSIRCVENGVEVDSFLSLHKATLQQNVIILQKDIIDDFGIYEQGKNFYVGENIQRISSTYDTKFYGTETPQVITLLQFKNDLYGNGYVINANNVTNVSNADRFNGKALFNGPLNFVSMGNLASVKAQDNICFAVYENVKINNVELIGYTFNSNSTQNNLADLDYAGTVVEVLGDNVTIEYCRISNGRTVLRAFGDIENKEKAINVTLKNSVLSNAREFLVRIGSNLVKYDERTATEIDAENYNAPLLDGEEFNFPAGQNYNNLSNEEKAIYEQKYIKTFVTIENSVLKDAGLFCVGIDTHFAGPMLLDALECFQFLKNSEWATALANWKNLSATSYGAKLTFTGDVRMYNWKNINDYDSSTLIEIGAGANSDLIEKLKFDVKEMISHLGNTSMVYRENGEEYVHGGIVFFGGGNNYGVFENKSNSFAGLIENGVETTLEGYSVTLEEVGQETLEMAAGNKPFYFVLYNANSNFIPPVQNYILTTGNAFDCIYRKGN